MFKFNNKRDVDRHVSQMSQKLSENEVKLDRKNVERGFREKSENFHDDALMR